LVVGGAAACIGLVAPSASGTSAVAAKTHTVVGAKHAVLSSYTTGTGPMISCPPGKSIQNTTCYLVGAGPGGTAPPGVTPFSPFDYLFSVIPIHNGKVGKPVDFPGAESASVISCPSAGKCDTAGYSNTYAKAALIPVTNGKPGTPVAVAGIVTWSSIDCQSAGNCVAVGTRDKNSSGTVRWGVIAYLHNGKLASEQVLKSAGEVDGVSCTSKTTCLAVGSTFSTSFNGHGFFATVKNGHAGKLHVIKKTGGLFSVTCGWVKGSCVAAGDTLVGTSSSYPNRVVIHGNSSHVTTLKSASAILGAGYTCPKTGSCVYYGVVAPNSAQEHAAIALVHNGKIGAAITIHGTNAVDDVACSEVGSCTTTGNPANGKYGDDSLTSFTLHY
jgi:hypothetical protein